MILLSPDPAEGPVGTAALVTGFGALEFFFTPPTGAAGAAGFAPLAARLAPRVGRVERRVLLLLRMSSRDWLSLSDMVLVVCGEEKKFVGQM